MQIINLNHNWRVFRREDAFSMVSSVPEDAVLTDIPYDALFHDRQTEDSLNGGRTGYFDGGVYYYQKEFDLPESFRQKRLFLKCEGLFSKSFVYVNGSLVKSGSFGYVSVQADITDYVKTGDRNILLIICKTDVFSSRWYSGTGILRPVTLLAAEDIYTVPDSLYIRTENINDEGASLRIRADLRKDAPGAELTECEIIFREGDEIRFRKTWSVRISGLYHFDQRIFLPQAHLYSEDDPYLYTVVFRIGNDETVIRTGIRRETFDSVHGLCINGKTVKLRGACLHHDQGILGGISLKAFEYYRISLLKEAGFNAVRSAHNHPSEELLEVCDALGVYVLDEICDMWTKMKGFGDFAQYFQSDWKETVDQMVREDRNHPCVIGYSTGNEISDINTEKGFETAHGLFERIRQLDDERFVTNGINGAFAAGEELIDIAADLTGMDRSVFESGDVNQFMSLMATRMNDIVTHPVVSRVVGRMESCVDVQGYNYMTARYRKDSETYPDRIMLGTETYPRQIAENWRLIKELPAVIGDFTWTGWDYMGELSAPFPALNNPAGDIDRFGFRRPVSYYREIVFGLREEPYVCVRPPHTYGTPRMFGPWKFTDAEENWTFDIPQGQTVTVEVYSCEKEAELYLNDRLVGRKEMQDCYALFDVPYCSGQLKAVTPSGRTFILQSADETTAHIVRDDREYDGYVFSRISVQDQNGILCLGAECECDCRRDGMELIAAASEKTVHDRGFLNEKILVSGRGGLAVYRKKTADC